MKRTYIIIVRDAKQDYIVTTKVVESVTSSLVAKKWFYDLKDKYPRDNIKVYLTDEVNKFKRIEFEKSSSEMGII
jgi:hypothetical protein